jgi:O-antigen biosynthesis protein
MKFSIITPTHRISDELSELYDSICDQTYSDWEWILFLNNGPSRSDLPESFLEDDRIVIHESLFVDDSVGSIKNAAFHKGSGDILVEADHDDLLHPECLAKLREAFSDEAVGFAYSDCLLYDQRGLDQKMFFTPVNGWIQEWQEFRGEDYFVGRAFEPTARSLSYIWYAPDHVRAWRSELYKQIGGHNPEYRVADDHELLIRTYLSTKMKHIPEVLYYYRIQPEKKNTYLDRNQEIQDTTKQLFHKYARILAEHDARKAGLMLVDIGGGLFGKHSYTTIDKRETADIVCDLEQGIPLPDNSVGVLNASHVIEHLSDPVKTMSEIHRVLCDGGWAFIDVPSTDGRGAWQDPTHISFWNQNSFFYYTRAEQAQFIDNTTIKFQPFKLETVFENEWSRINDIPVVKAILCAVKSDERRPHTLEI